MRVVILKLGNLFLIISLFLSILVSITTTTTNRLFHVTNKSWQSQYAMDTSQQVEMIKSILIKKKTKSKNSAHFFVFITMQRLGLTITTNKWLIDFIYNQLFLKKWKNFIIFNFFFLEKILKFFVLSNEVDTFDSVCEDYIDQSIDFYLFLGYKNKD